MANKIKEFHDLLVAFMAGYTGGTKLNLPEQSGTLTYSGSAQSPTWSGYDASQLLIGGTTSATNAGTYTATFTPKEGYKWADGTANPKNVTWTIAKADGLLTLSESSGATTAGKPFTFSVTGNKSGGILSVQSADTSYVTASISGTTVTVNYVAKRAAGTNVTVTSAATANYKETTATIKVISSTTITEMTLSATSGTVTVGGKKTFTVTTPSDKALTVRVSPSTVASASISGNTVTVTGKKIGEATVTVKQAASGDYTAANATYALTCRETALITDSWATISSRAQAGTAANYYDIGDYKEITLNGKIGDCLTLENEKLRVFILHINYPMNGVASNNIVWGGFQNADGVNVALADGKHGNSSTDGTIRFNMNHWGNVNYGGWKGSDLRYDILGATSTPPSDYGKLHTTSCVGYNATAATLTNPKANTLLAALPSDFRNVLRLWTRWVDAKGGAGTFSEADIEATVDAVTLLCVMERHEPHENTNVYEQNHQTRMDYCAVSVQTYIYKHASPENHAWAWLISAYKNTAGFNIAYRTGVTQTSSYPSSQSRGLAPAFLT